MRSSHTVLLEILSLEPGWESLKSYKYTQVCLVSEILGEEITVQTRSSLVLSPLKKHSLLPPFLGICRLGRRAGGIRRMSDTATDAHHWRSHRASSQTVLVGRKKIPGENGEAEALEGLGFKTQNPEGGEEKEERTRSPEDTLRWSGWWNITFSKHKEKRRQPWPPDLGECSFERKAKDLQQQLISFLLQMQGAPGIQGKERWERALGG